MQERPTPLHETRYFFTWATQDRQPWLCRTHEIQLLRSAFRFAMGKCPFKLDAVCVLPDHLHCVWQLPEGDADHSTRWRLLLSWFAKNYRGKGNILQPEYREQIINDSREYNWYLDYIHFDPVKHGHARNAKDWPWSSFHALVKRGIYHPNWGEHIELDELTRFR